LFAGVRWNAPRTGARIKPNFSPLSTLKSST
jgi:hypothetical protein